MKWAIRVMAAVSMLSGHASATGNGAQSGTHYNLNILGKDNCSPADLTGSNRHSIQVLLNYSPNIDGQVYSTLDKTNVIVLQKGDDFQVLDGNACDKGGALFQLPVNPFTCDLATDPACADPEFQEYLVYARALGKGSATITTCTTGAGIDGILGNADDEVICSTENKLLVRNKRNSFDNVTKELTTVYADVDADGVIERMGIFDDSLRSYMWEYDNTGLRIAQLRFYPIAE